MKICVSSSCRFEKEWAELKEKFKTLDCDIVTPVVRDLTGKNDSEIDLAMELTNKLFLKEVEECDYLYVYCPDGYIGKGVAAEIGYALAKDKDITSSEEIDDNGICSLVNNVKTPEKYVEYVRGKNV